MFLILEHVKQLTACYFGPQWIHLLSITVAEHLLCELRKWDNGPGPDEYTAGDSAAYWELVEDFMTHYELTIQAAPCSEKPEAWAQTTDKRVEMVASRCAPCL